MTWRLFQGKEENDGPWLTYWRVMGARVEVSCQILPYDSGPAPVSLNPSLDNTGPSRCAGGG